jgi:hypothetical protein
MLDAHGGILNPGEVDFLFDYLERDASQPRGWSYRRDEMRDDRIFRSKNLTLDPALEGLDLLENMIAQLGSRRPGLLVLNVHRHIDRLIEVLPGVRIIHMLRDPRDVARSSIGMGWAGTLFHGVDHWIASERAWDKALPRMAAGQVFEFSYERLFSDPENMLRQVCQFLDQPYTASMLNYHQTSTYAPPDKSLVEQWRHNSKSKEIALLEGKAGTLMMARGYALNGPSRQPGTIEAGALYLTNKAAIWRKGILRYGAFTFISERVTRKLGLMRLNRHFRSRIREKSVSFLK